MVRRQQIQQITIIFITYTLEGCLRVLYTKPDKYTHKKLTP